jgi:hypothetical protein
MVSAQAHGIQFENEVHKLLQNTKHDVLLNEKEIRKQEPTITAIDHLLIANNICFCFQDKWLKTNISNSNFNHFSKCVEKVAIKLNNSMKIYGVYICNNDFSSIANKQLEEENNKYKLGQSIIEYIKINNMVKDVIYDTIQKLLHSNNIFMYDKDGDCIMN